MSCLTIFISGTPCTGKTTVSQALYNKLNLENYVKLIHVNDLVDYDNNLVLGFDNKKDYKEIDLDLLDKNFNKERDLFLNEKTSKSKILIFEGHLTHFCSNPSKVIILRVHPNVLKDRLSKRNYKDSKIYENLESEALDVCGAESYEYHPDNTYEIDVTNLSIDEIVDKLIDIINGGEASPVGSINFMDWILNH
ncbi:hypothetical protein BGI41_02745 [Methanobrevibacter sp. 87.7]|uniref:adenylate kinase family protein n=1 Tax=Methanobrevibacter sp. 87.7 TaxID=387957 RepID=UPI000B50F74C|nr:adenylate kinase family protein [Methanobrevibacter sp. 87.7]OWT33378.1 hypothetical protein BGI41_02745 [Methanobrevibacter sp. 87.7]